MRLTVVCSISIYKAQVQSTSIVDAYLVFFHYMQQMHIGQQIPYRVLVQRPDICIYITWGRFFWFLALYGCTTLATRGDSIWDPPSPSLVILTPFLLCTCGSISLHVEKLKRLRRGQKSRDLAPHLCILDGTTCKGKKKLLSSKSLFCLEKSISYHSFTPSSGSAEPPKLPFFHL